MKRIVTMDELNKIAQAIEDSKGTSDYHKYYLPCETKRKRFIPQNPQKGYRYFEDKRWSSWRFIGWTTVGFHSNRPKLKYYLKQVKGKLYIMSEEYQIFNGELCMDRYEVTDAIKELLGLEE